VITADNIGLERLCITKILEYKVDLCKNLHAAICSLVMSLWPYDFLVMSLYCKLI